MFEAGKRSGRDDDRGLEVKARPSHQRLWRYGPLVVWATLIFIGSSSILSSSNTSTLMKVVRWLVPGAGDEKLVLVHFLLRKAGHLTVYAILALLAVRAFRTSSRPLLRTHWFWSAFILVAVYSLTDEFHQSFVPSRTGSIYDCIIDSVGGLIALTILWWRSKRAENSLNLEQLKSDAAA